MNVSSDALNTKEKNDEHARNDDDGNSETQKDEGQQEDGEGSHPEENFESDQNEPRRETWKQSSNRPRPDEAQGRRNTRGNREGNRLAESAKSLQAFNSQAP
jgi:hypothetical protein